MNCEQKRKFDEGNIKVSELAYQQKTRSLLKKWWYKPWCERQIALCHNVNKLHHTVLAWKSTRT